MKFVSKKFQFFTSIFGTKLVFGNMRFSRLKNNTLSVVLPKVYYFFQGGGFNSVCRGRGYCRYWSRKNTFLGSVLARCHGGVIRKPVEGAGVML